MSTSERVLCALAAMPLAMAAAEAGTGVVQPLAVRPDGSPNRAVWMARGSFGVMTHYLFKPKGETPAERTAELNRIVDQFDVEGYLGQFRETGADWLIFTLGQTTGYLCSPNAYLDAFTGRPATGFSLGGAGQSQPVQAVSGATISSKAVLDAVNTICRAAQVTEER